MPSCVTTSACNIGYCVQPRRIAFEQGRLFWFYSLLVPTLRIVASANTDVFKKL